MIPSNVWNQSVGCLIWMCINFPRWALHQSCIRAKILKVGGAHHSRKITPCKHDDLGQDPVVQSVEGRIATFFCEITDLGPKMNPKNPKLKIQNRQPILQSSLSGG